MLKLLWIFLIIFIGCKEDTKAPKVSQVKDETVLVAKQFKSLWDTVTSDPLETLPQNEVSYGSLSTLFRNIILEDAQRTLSNHADILPRFDKLAHPNGICLKGLWEINTKNSYSGYFKEGSQALVVARASSAMSNTKRGEIRALGMAIKIFPTLNPLELTSENSANFIVIDDLGGTRAEFFTDVALTNEPSISTNSEVLKFIVYGLKVADAFSEADENPNIRQLYEVSELKENKEMTIITPKWIKIEAQKGQAKLAVSDFREEFYLEKNEKIIFNVSVASSKINEIKQWITIGTLSFDDSIVSDSCDHRLHFHHPQWRDDLIYE